MWKKWSLVPRNLRSYCQRSNFLNLLHLRNIVVLFYRWDFVQVCIELHYPLRGAAMFVILPSTRKAGVVCINKISFQYIENNRYNNGFCRGFSNFFIFFTSLIFDYFSAREWFCFIFSGLVSFGWTCLQISTTIFILFWNFLMVEQIFLLPQMKRSVIISNTLRYTSCLTSRKKKLLPVLVKISRKVEIRKRKLNFSCRAYFTWKLEFVSNTPWTILANIVGGWQRNFKLNWF